MKGSLLFVCILLGAYFAYQSNAKIVFAGVNESGAEFNSGAKPGRVNFDYTFPKTSSIDYFLSKGMNTFRIPFLWERIQYTLNGPLETTFLKNLNTTVSYITSKGGYALLDVHNYIKYNGSKIGTAAVPFSAFRYFWKELATAFKNNPRVIFGLMNEPNGIATETVLTAMQEGIYGVRESGATQLIFVEGNGYTGVHSWKSSWYGTPNAVVMGNITDPLNNYAYEMHQYFDSDSSGTSPTCKSTWNTTSVMNGATTWLRSRGLKGFIGEFGFANNTWCMQVGESFLSYLDANSDVWLGYTYWSAGPWWGNYMYNVEPLAGGVDRDQMAVLSRHVDVGTLPTKYVLYKGVNMGSSTNLTIGGQKWQSQSLALTNGLRILPKAKSTSSSSVVLSPATDVNTTTMLRSELYAESGYNLSLALTAPQGKYRVYCWVSENYQSNYRSFDIKVEAKTFYRAAGNFTKGSWKKYGPMDVTVSDGELSVDFVKLVSPPHIHGLEVYRAL